MGSQETTLTKEEFLDYLRAFNTPDYDKQHAFYLPECQLVLPDPAIGTLHGSDAIKAHYAPIHDASEETVIPIAVAVDYPRIFLIMETYFRYTKAGKAVHDMTVAPGDVIQIRSWATYEMEGKKMKRITCLLQEENFLGQVDVAQYVAKSKAKADPGVQL